MTTLLHKKYKKDIFTLIYEGNLSATSEAIKNGDVTLYHRNDKGQTLLHWAVLYNQIKIAQKLITLRASLDITDNQGNTVRDVIIEKNLQNLLVLRNSTKTTNFEEYFVEHEQYDDQNSCLLGCIKNSCTIF
jgi:ankyrin repeat protein